MKMHPYLAFNGQCEEALNAYAGILGGKVRALMTFAEAGDDMPVEPDWLGKVMHAELEFGDNVIMATDAPPQYARPMQGISVSLHFEDAAEGKRIFEALAEGGEIGMPFEPTFWSAGFGMVLDRFGTPWMVNCNPAS